MSGSTARNALSAAAQTAVTTAAGLFYFGFLMRSLGPEVLGGWLAWLALGMVACLADLGLRESLVRRAAVARAEGDTPRLIALIDSTVVSVALTMGLALLLLMGLGPQLVHLGAAAEQTPGWIVGGVALMVWLQRVADVHAAALEGLQRYDRVARNNVVGALAGLATLLLTVRVWGVDVASLGLIVQYLVSGLAHQRTLRELLPERGWRPRHARYALAREGLGYGLSVQTAIGSFLLIESIAKVLLARADALALLSYFDLAFRIGRGLRNLLVAGNRVLVPRLAAAHADAAEGHAQSFDAMYLRSCHLLFLLVLAVFSVALGASSLVALATRGSVEPDFILAFLLTLPVWMIFGAVDPVINASMGSGAMRLVVLAHGAMLGLLLLLVGAGALALSHWPGLAPHAGPATLLAVLVSVSLPCLAMLLAYHRRQRLPLATLSPGRSLAVGLACFAVGAGVNALDASPWVQGPAWIGASLLVLLLLRGLPAWAELSLALRRRLGRPAG